MRFSIVDSISKSYKTYNEDMIGYNENAVWIIDGASALNSQNIISKKENDVVWYINAWNQYLYNNLTTKKSILEILKEGIEYVKNKANISNILNIDKFNLPSASIAIIRKIDNFLEYYVLGDCSIIIKDNEKIESFKDDKVSKFDNLAIECIKNEKTFNCDFFKGYSKNVLDVLIKNRGMKNNINGYWILEFDVEAIENGIYGKYEIYNEAQILMTTDGFSIYRELYKKETEHKFIQEVNRYGLKEIYKRLRNIEKKDSNGTKYPRLRKHDDSSAIFMKI